MGSIDDLHAFSRHGQAPQPGQYPQAINNSSSRSQGGAWLASRLHLGDNLELTLGGRYSQQQQKSYNRSTASLQGARASRFTPYLGIHYQLTPQASVYASYSRLFSPQNQKDQNGVYLAPISGEHYETGLKGSWHEGRLNATLALYQNRKNHRAVAAGRDASGDTWYRATDRATTRGWEIELDGEITPGWNLQAGYSQTHSRDQNGKRLNSETTPRHSAKLFTNYQINEHWNIGGGVRWQSATWSDTVLGRVSDDAAKTRALAASRQNAYAVIDLMAQYHITPAASISLNIDNLTNRHYRTQPDRHSYGEPRSIMAGFKYQF